MSGSVVAKSAAAVLAIAMALGWPAVASAQTGAASRAHPVKSKKRPTVVIRPGYGFLPGYEPQLPNSIPAPYGYGYHFSGSRYPRYWDWWGRRHYGYGSPGFYRGRYNGGSIGPCYTQTPIGPVWNCGR
jgi:hypothetical protein